MARNGKQRKGWAFGGGNSRPAKESTAPTEDTSQTGTPSIGSSSASGQPQQVNGLPDWEDPLAMPTKPPAPRLKEKASRKSSPATEDVGAVPAVKAPNTFSSGAPPSPSRSRRDRKLKMQMDPTSYEAPPYAPKELKEVNNPPELNGGEGGLENMIVTFDNENSINEEITVDGFDLDYDASRSGRASYYDNAGRDLRRSKDRGPYAYDDRDAGGRWDRAYLDEPQPQQRGGSVRSGGPYVDERGSVSRMGPGYPDERGSAGRMGPGYFEERGSAGRMGPGYLEERGSAGRMGPGYLEERGSGGRMGPGYVEKRSSASSRGSRDSYLDDRPRSSGSSRGGGGEIYPDERERAYLEERERRALAEERERLRMMEDRRRSLKERPVFVEKRDSGRARAYNDERLMGNRDMVYNEDRLTPKDLAYTDERDIIAAKERVFLEERELRVLKERAYLEERELRAAKEKAYLMERERLLASERARMEMGGGGVGVPPPAARVATEEELRMEAMEQEAANQVRRMNAVMRLKDDKLYGGGGDDDDDEDSPPPRRSAGSKFVWKKGVNNRWIKAPIGEDDDGRWYKGDRGLQQVNEYEVYGDNDDDGEGDSRRQWSAPAGYGRASMRNPDDEEETEEKRLERIEKDMLEEAMQRSLRDCSVSSHSHALSGGGSGVVEESPMNAEQREMMALAMQRSSRGRRQASLQSKDMDQSISRGSFHSTQTARRRGSFHRMSRRSSEPKMVGLQSGDGGGGPKFIWKRGHNNKWVKVPITGNNFGDEDDGDGNDDRGGNELNVDEGRLEEMEQQLIERAVTQSLFYARGNGNCGYYSCDD